MDYRLTLPRRIEFRCGAREQLGSIASQLGRRVWLVNGSRTLERNGVIDRLRAICGACGLSLLPLPVASREPQVQDVDALVRQVREAGTGEADVVLGIGGGSAIDLAKAVAALATQPGGHSIRDYLEGIGRGRQLTAPPLPIIAMPTTAGTGSEATCNAVISSTDPPVKKSLRSESLIPSAVIIDPELTLTVPPDVTAATGMDALTQLIESFLSRRANAFTDGLCRAGLQAGLPMLARACRDGHDIAARTAMSHAAFLSGMALANSGLGMAHGVAAALGVVASVPHGLACAVMLPSTLRANLTVRLDRIAEIGRMLPTVGLGMASDHEAANAAIDFIEQLCDELDIPRRLSELGITRAQLPRLVATSRGNSMSGNPRDIDDAELLQLLQQIC
ncbi:MAG: iron-containing alcohol dehydrogenase [Planctomycetaceae bacterium]